MALIRTTLLLATLTVLLLAIGYLLAGSAGMTTALIFAFVMNFAMYWFSDKIVLAMYRAKPSNNKRLNSIVEKLAKETNIPKPKVYIIPIEVPNAFATGRSKNHAAVAATEGILKMLDDDEIEGVLAHELGHVKNRDMLIATMAATIAGAISYIAQFAWFGMGNRENRNSLVALLALIFAPLAAMLIQMAISRNREYGADYTGAYISKKPLALASALEKISAVAAKHPIQGPPATAHLFIVNPFKGQGLMAIFSTHPPVEKRVARLKEIAKSMK